jgi:hypothetical protein
MDEDTVAAEDSPFDVVGNARKVDAVPSTSDDVDMGAYEHQGDEACEGDTNQR